MLPSVDHVIGNDDSLSPEIGAEKSTILLHDDYFLASSHGCRKEDAAIGKPYCYVEGIVIQVPYGVGR